MDLNPSEMVSKLKTYYIEIVCATFFALAFGYFCYGIYGNKQNAEFLVQAKSKLLLMEARQNRVIEQKINEEEDKSCRECFEAALADAGFKILKIEHKLNHISAVVVNNASARARLHEILDGVQYIENRDSLEVRWFFNKKKYEVAISNTEGRENASFAVSAICYFDDASWQVWIDGKLYDSHNKILPDGTIIEKVSSSCVILKTGSKTRKIELYKNYQQIRKQTIK